MSATLLTYARSTRHLRLVVAAAAGLDLVLVIRTVEIGGQRTAERPCGPKDERDAVWAAAKNPYPSASLRLRLSQLTDPGVQLPDRYYETVTIFRNRGRHKPEVLSQRPDK